MCHTCVRMGMNGLFLGHESKMWVARWMCIIFYTLQDNIMFLVNMFVAHVQCVQPASPWCEPPKKGVQHSQRPKFITFEHRYESNSGNVNGWNYYWMVETTTEWLKLLLLAIQPIGGISLWIPAILNPFWVFIEPTGLINSARKFKAKITMLCVKHKK